MPRYKLTLEYDGTKFFGWQRQNDAVTVQGALQAAFLDFCQQDVDIVASGRTDAGVHALGMVAHVDLAKPVKLFSIVHGLNFHLFNAGMSVAVLHAEEVTDDFHARFSATSRSYMYRIISRPAPLIIDKDRAWLIHETLDIAAMQQAARILEGHHDFSSFRGKGCQSKSPMKTLDAITVTQIGNETRFTFTARSFLYHMVRILVGSLYMVGKGEWKPEHINSVIAAKDRVAGGPTAPPEGLYFIEAVY